MTPSERKKTECVLAEFLGITIGVYVVIWEWYPITTTGNKRNQRWGFNGEDAPDEISLLYKNKSIMQTKKRGAIFPFRYKL